LGHFVICVARTAAVREVRFSGNEYALAYDYANTNASFLRPHGTGIAVVAIQVDETSDTVLVTTRADVTLLFPRFAPLLLQSQDQLPTGRGLSYLGQQLHRVHA
jgi:hypothetical protein